MDLSVFNLLMSTTPAVAGTETSFSGQAETNAAAQAAQMQEPVKTGEAFLKVLEQVRAGKTEKSAETFFNTMSAQADAASSLKNFKTNEKTNEEVKVVKLHIKRTRASEKLQKAQENTTAATETVQNRQKIPGQENIAAPQQTKTAVPVENAARINADQQDIPVLVIPDQTPEAASNDPVVSDELTAADILVSAALQTNTVQSAKTQPETIELPQTADNEILLQTDPAAQKEMPVRTNDDTTEIPQTAKQPLLVEQNPVSAEQSPVLPQSKEKISLPAGLETKTTLPAAQTETPEQDGGIVSLKETDRPEKTSVSVPAKETPRTEPVQKQQHLNEHEPVLQTVTAQAEPAAEITDFSDQPRKEARQQADRLAAALPADTKIAVTVETNKPAAAAFRPVRPADEKNTAERKTAVEKNPQTDLFMPADSAVNQTEHALSPAETKTPSDNSAQARTENRPAQNLTNNLIALPVEQKSFSNAVQTAGGTETATGAVNTNAPNTQTGQTFIPAGQELKGKAVSGTTAPHRAVPVNELADQIKVNIKKALKAGLDKIDVVLKHKDLGTIKVHLEIDKDGNMKAVLSTARADTLDLLRSDLQGLKQALTDSGFNMNDEAFSFNYRGERYNDERGQNEQRHTGAADTEEEEIHSRPAPSAADYSGRYALNIRV